MKNVYLLWPPISLSRGNPECQFLGYLPREFYIHLQTCVYVYPFKKYNTFLYLFYLSILDVINISTCIVTSFLMAE